MTPLPPWDPTTSDGCTDSPDSGWWGIHRPCCLEHDRDYYYGGSQADRLASDLRLYQCLISRDMPTFIAVLYYQAVRVFGGPSLRRPGVSWAYGGSRFRYTD